MDLSKLNIFGKIYNFKDTEARSKGEENAKSVGALREKLSSLKTISVSPTTPIDDNTELWIDPDATEGFSIPEINDDVTNTSDTWSSKKINNELQSLSNENNKKLENKVSIIEGKSLSTNDYTNEEKEKLKSLKNYDDSVLKAELYKKLTTPTGNVKVGQLLLVKSKNDDGSVVLETVEMPSESVGDVQINGTSIVKDGVAEIPLCTTSKAPGLIAIDIYSNSGGLYRANNDTGLIRIAKASDNSLTERKNEFCPVVPRNLDYAVKSAMCDGKGVAWKAEEQAAARDRIGIDEYEDVLDVTLEEDSSFSADFEHEYKQLYIYIDQSGVTEKIYAVIYLYPYSYVDGEGKKINTFGSYYPPTSKAYPNVASVWKSYGKVVTKIASVTNDQKNTTGNQTACLKVWDTSMLNINGIGDSFKGIYPSATIFKAGTRIVVKGVRA